jgi:lipopolysaccharide exporter
MHDSRDGKAIRTKKDHYWLKSGSLSIIQNMYGVLLGFGSFFCLVRMLDKESFGVWTLFLVTTTIFDAARSGLIQNALIKFLSHGTEEERPEILSASFFLSAVLMTACIIINISMAGFLSRIWHYPELKRMFYLFNIVYLLQGILSQFHWIEQANLSFKGLFVTNFIKQAGLAFFVMFCFFLHIRIGLETLIYVQGISVFAAMVVQYFYVRRFLVFKYRTNPVWIKKLFNYGKFAFGTSISSMLAGTLDQMMLGAMLSPVASGAFNVSQRIISLVDIPTNAIAVIVFPQSAKRMVTDGHHAIKYLYEKSVGTILAILLPNLLFLWLFPNLVVHIIAGAKYPESVSILKVTVFYCLFIPFNRQFGTIIDSIGKPKITLTLVILATAFLLTMNYITIPIYGIMGVVYSTLFSHLIVCTIMLIILKKKLNVNPLNTFLYAAKFYPELFVKYIRPVLVKK